MLQQSINKKRFPVDIVRREKFYHLTWEQSYVRLENIYNLGGRRDDKQREICQCICGRIGDYSR